MQSLHSSTPSRPLPSPALHAALSHSLRSTANRSESYGTPPLPQGPLSAVDGQLFAALDSYEWPYLEALLAGMVKHAKYATWRTHDHLRSFTYLWDVCRFDSTRGIWKQA